MTFNDIADFALQQQDIPDRVLDFAATLLIDTIGVAAGATALKAGRIARDHAFAFHGAGEPSNAVPMMFDGRLVSLPGAAFAAATQIDNLDAHDGYNPTKGHISCALVPALFAFANTRPNLSARSALAAYAISYEIAARAGMTLHDTVSDYHTSGAWNALGVAALGCRLMDQNANTLRQALGIAEYHGPRSQMMREIANPTMLHDGSGMGALVGSMAALLARDGFVGAPAITVGSGDHWHGLGTFWTIENSYIKPYPVCRWAHAAIDALSLLMRDNRVHAGNISQITVNTFTQAAELFPGMPHTTSQAQYSLAFALGVMLIHGQIAPRHISGAGLQDPDVASVLPRIHVHNDHRHSERFPNGRWSDVTVTLLDGTPLSSGDIHAKGGPEAPIPITDVEAKFHTMAACLPKPQRAAIWAMRDRLLHPATAFSELAGLVMTPSPHALGQNQ